MPKAAINPYKTLGIDPAATPEDVKAAFRNRAKQVHPDAGGNQDAFERVKFAQMVLLDPVRRKQYDETGEIDDPNATQSPDHRALEMIAGALQNILKKEEDPFAFDLVEVITRHYREEINKLGQVIASDERTKKRAEKLIKRFKRRKAGNNVVVAILNNEIVHIERVLVPNRAMLKDMHRAIEIINEYEFQVEKVVQHFVSPFGTTAFGGMTGGGGIFR